MRQPVQTQLVVHYPDAVGPAGGGAAAAWGVTWAGPRRRPAHLLLSRRSPNPLRAHRQVLSCCQKVTTVRQARSKAAGALEPQFYALR